MIYLELFLGFLKVGLFSFGGAYAAIPLIREVVLDYGWIDDEFLSVMIGVSESTPGPIMVNLATYVGANQGGVLGSAVATFAVVLPAFVIILLAVLLLKALLQKPLFSAVLNALKVTIVGVICAIGLYMTCEQLYFLPRQSAFAWQTYVIASVLCAVTFLPPLFKKKKISPLLLIALSAVLGVALFSI